MSWTGGSFGERARCVLAPNANMMTLDGTNTWVLREPGARRSVVIDPGPPDESHLDAVAEQAGDVGVVLLTHHHLDHSEAAKEFAERVGCGVRALDPEYRLGSEGLGGGDVVEVDGLEIRVVATPGHTADSLSFVLPAEAAVLTGDTVLGRGTTVVAHPDGQLGAYLDSLDRLHALAEAHEIGTIWPGHGPVIDDALGALDYYIAHRAERLAAGRGGAWPTCATSRTPRDWPPTSCRAGSWRSSTPTSTRCSGERPSSRSAPSWRIWRTATEPQHGQADPVRPGGIPRTATTVSGILVTPCGEVGWRPFVVALSVVWGAGFVWARAASTQPTDTGLRAAATAPTVRRLRQRDPESRSRRRSLKPKPSRPSRRAPSSRAEQRAAQPRP